MSSPSIEQVARGIQDIKEALASVVIDQLEAIQHCLLAVACGGHVLIEDVPGVGKTTLARSMAQVLGLHFQRIQGTPDRLPAEITGSSVWDSRTGEFRFVQGPIFGQCVLFDELNRAPAKTQAALLEAMEEGQVTVDGTGHPLPRPFLVLATQNPIELEGTFPLPEAALDRFLVRVHLGYPTAEGEKRLMRTWEAPRWRMDAKAVGVTLQPRLQTDAIFALRQMVAQINFSSEAEDYLLALLNASRSHPDILLGLSPRAGLSIRQASQAWALFAGRNYVRPDDIQTVWIPVAAHRLVLQPQADLERKTPERVLQAILEVTPVPGSWAGLVASRSAPAGGR